LGSAVAAVTLTTSQHGAINTPPDRTRSIQATPQRAAEIWQGGIVRLPAWIDNKEDPAGPPYRPAGALWVSLRTGLVHMGLPSEVLS
jgi:hypothetical protein